MLNDDKLAIDKLFVGEFEMCKIGLVLSGGMAKGAYQVGALKAINEYFKPQDISCISSSSIGVLNAYAYAANKLFLAEEIWKEICCEENRKFITSICKGPFIQRSIKSLVSNDDNISPYFYTTLYNVYNNTLTYFNMSETNKENWELYLKASVAMPFYSKAININGNAFLDGAMIDNIPVYPLQKHNMDYIICIYFDECNYIFENEFVNSKIIKLVFSDKSIIKNSVFLDKKIINYMIKNGYQQTRDFLEIILSKGINDKEYIYKNINLYNKLNSNIKFRVTGDMIVSNCNKIAKKIIKRKIII